MIGVGLSLPQVAVRRTPASAAGPTVILNANWLTDTIINLSDVPVSNGEFVKSWAMATGGTWTSALAIAAGAADAPTYVTASGVETLGASAALTCATPVTIPADQDAIIYVLGVFGAGQMFAIGSSSGTSNLQIDNGGALVSLNSSAGGTAVSYTGAPSGAALLRVRILRGTAVVKFAWTGQAEHNAVDEGFQSSPATTVFDTLLAVSSMGTLAYFSPSGCYLKKIKITIGTSDIDTTYETANGGTL